MMSLDGSINSTASTASFLANAHVHWDGIFSSLLGAESYTIDQNRNLLFYPSGVAN